MRQRTAEDFIDALKALFIECSAPLVIKSDNGSAFTAEQMADSLRARRVMHLLSSQPAPSYNGACEAGMGSLKVRAHHESARNNRRGRWTRDEVQASRLIIDETARPIVRLRIIRLSLAGWLRTLFLNSGGGGSPRLFPMQITQKFCRDHSVRQRNKHLFLMRAYFSSLLLKTCSEDWLCPCETGVD